MKMSVNSIVYYKGEPCRVIRGAPVRFGERRVVIQRRDGRRFTVKMSLLTMLAPDKGQAVENSSTGEAIAPCG